MSEEITHAAKRLKNVDLFRHLPEDVLGELVLKSQTCEYESDLVLFRKGELGDAIYVILSGWVKVVTEDAQGEELVLNHCGPGEAVGEVSLLDGEPRSASVVTLMPVKAMVLKRDAFMDVLEQHPLLGMSIMRGLTAKIRLSTTYIEKAIEWSHRVAQGDYHSAIDQINSEQSIVVTRSRSDEARVGEFLSAFFRMIEGVRKREEDLKRQVQELTIQVDQARREQEVNELMQTPFYKKLKTARGKIRRSDDTTEE
jgi:CRP-like cAMP-binding protein